MQDAGTPLISSMIPSIDALVQVINKFKDNAKHLAAQSAAMWGLAILNT